LASDRVSAGRDFGLITVLRRVLIRQRHLRHSS
jgi:hypothetical protein